MKFESLQPTLITTVFLLKNHVVSSSQGGEDALKAPNTVIIHAEKDGIHDIQGYILGLNVISYPLVVTAIEFTHVRTRLVSGYVK